MPRHDYSYQPGDTPQGVVRNLRNLRPGYELRKKWSYNNQVLGSLNAYNSDRTSSLYALRDAFQRLICDYDRCTLLAHT